MPSGSNALRALVEKHTRDTTKFNSSAIPSLTLLRADAPNPEVNTIYRPALCVVAQGSKQVTLGNSVFAYGEGSYFVVTIEVPVRGCVVQASQEKPYLGLTYTLDPGRIGELLIELASDDDAHGQPEAPTPVLAASSLDRPLTDSLVRLLELLDHPRDAKVLAPLLEKEILFRLLQGRQGNVLRQVATAGSPLSQIARAVDWIRNNYARATSVEEMANEAAMSVTSFHRHFKAVTMMTPLQYRAQIRLQEARRLILASGQDAGAIGALVGYDSSSQFSREYRRMFGLPPSADAARLRRNE